VGCLVTKDIVQAVEILTFGTLLQSTHNVVRIHRLGATALWYCHCVSTHITAGYPYFELKTAKKRGEGVVGCCQSQSKDSNLVMCFDHDQNHVGRADCISPVVSISFISEAGRMSHIVYNFFICFMVFTVVFNVDTGSSNFDARSTRVPVRASAYTQISVTLLTVNYFHFFKYIFHPA